MKSVKRLNRTPLVVYVVMLCAVVLLALLAPFLPIPDPLQMDISRRLQPPSWLIGSDSAHLLGTDSLGRDVLSRIVYGARTSLIVSGLAVSLSAFIGITFGVLAGYWSGLVGSVVDRIADIQQTLPVIVVILALAAVTEPSLANTVFVLGISSWVSHYRVVRAIVYSVKQQPFIEAARALGNTSVSIVWRHVLPNVWPAAVANVTTFFPQMILFEAALSFLGLGIPPPTPTWGNMIADGRGYVEVAWWLTVFPGLALMLTVLAAHLLGDELTERLHPRGKGKGHR